MSCCFLTASARIRLLPAGRAMSTSSVLQQGKLTSSSKSTRAIAATVNDKCIKSTAAQPLRQFGTNGINSFNAATQTKRTESIEIPPLDLLSVLDIPTANKPRTEVSRPATVIDDSALETPKRGLISSKFPDSNTHHLDPNDPIPYYGVGDSDNPTSQPSSNPKKVLSEQISQLKKKLNNKSLSKIQRNKLQSRLKQKQNDLDRIGLPDDDNELKSKRGLGWDKREKMTRGTVNKREKRRSKKGRTHTSSIWENIINDSNSQESYPAAPRHQAKSYALPRPKASSRGVLIPDFANDVIKTQANGTILARSGTTSILSTVILVPPESTQSKNNVDCSFERKVLDSIQQMNARNGSLFLPLQVEYRERYHASGKIPTHNQRRRDNSGPLSDREVLASRAIDRTLRPWLMQGLAEFSANGNVEMGDRVSLPENIVVNCSVQSYDTRSSTMEQLRTHADPISLAINSAIGAIYQSAYSKNRPSAFPVPKEAAACVKLAMRRDGTVIYDPTPSEVEECAFELLYAGTRERVLMLEFSAKGEKGEIYSEDQIVDPAIPEKNVADALRLAQEAILPLIKHQEELSLKYSASRGMAIQKDEEEMSDKELAQLLGLSISQNNGMSTFESLESASISNQDAEQLLEEAYAFIWSKLEGAALKSFGCNAQETTQIPTLSAYIHDGQLPSKKLRGRRETLIQNEVTRLLRDEFQPNGEIAVAYHAAASDDSNTALLTALTNHIHERIMQRGFVTSAAKGFRSDGRGLNAVRPITATAPLFPDCVHGSSQFSRGETQVLSTATIAAPKDGTPIINPFANPLWKEDAKDDVNTEDEKVPVGSLRFLRSQVEMESDMNSRRVKAGREMTGDSGVLSERKLGFLHYDFPDYSTGSIKSIVGGAANRRAIGHGNLAERAILPILPRPDTFPYSIRLTCEVTSSNGSSSMASACGATLSMLDAGVPIIAPVAGVSVGLSGSETLLLDITGTEDHFGNMDCKVCGTFGGITAIQCDVKNPVQFDAIINALYLAKQGRHAILNEMNAACIESLGGLMPRSEMKSTAPRVEVIKYDPNRKRDLIGPGGTVLRQLEDRFNVDLDLSQEGRCLIFGSVISVEGAKNVIMDLVGDVEEGGIYEGTVIEIRDYGAVIELLRNKEGLLHVSEITSGKRKHPGGNLGLVNDYLKVGDKIQVLCTKIDHVQGSIKLSRRKLLQRQQYLSPIQKSEHNLDDNIEVLDDEYKDSDLESVEWQSEDESYRPYHDVVEEDGLEGYAASYDNSTSGDGGDGDNLYEDDLTDTVVAEESDSDGNSGDESKNFESSTDSDADEDSSLSLLTVPELREKLRNAGLPVRGKKSELIERLDSAP